MGKRGTASVLGTAVIVGLAAVALVAAAAVAGGGTARATDAGAGVTASVAAPSAVPTPAPSSIAVVRREAGRDALWSVAPGGGPSVELLDLGFRPVRVELSPDRTKLALLPSAAGPRVYVYDFAAGKLTTISLAGRGVRQVDALTWRSNKRLLVSGSRSAPAAYAFDDRIYAVNIETGRATWFRELHGTEPSVAGKAPRLVYVRLIDAGPSADQPGERVVRERLVTLRLAGGTKPRAIATTSYSSGLDIRAFKDPRIAPDGRRVITSTTGSDVSATYEVRTLATGARVLAKRTQLAGDDATAWNEQSTKVAFWGISITPPQATRIYVYDVAADRVTAGRRHADYKATGLSWAPDGSRLAYTLSVFGVAPDIGRLWVVDPASAAPAQELGAGGLPAWLP